MAIAVPDIEKAAAVYRDVLGAKVSEKVVSLYAIYAYMISNSDKYLPHCLCYSNISSKHNLCLILRGYSLLCMETWEMLIK